jgi:predicted component of type VI protein secretion system
VFAKTFPAVIGQEAGTVQVNDSVPGSCHCLVSLVDSQLVVWDLGTAGGTSVNGTRVTKAAIKPGDTLKLGGMEFQVKRRPDSRRYLFGVRS